MEYLQYSEQFASGVQAVAMEAWANAYKDIFDSSFISEFVNRNYSPEALNSSLARIAEGLEYFEIVVDDEKVIGFSNIGNRSDGWELFRIYISPQYLGLGLGKALALRGENFLRVKGANKYFCFVHKNNELGKSFYLKSGFVYISEKDTEDEWYMEKELH